MFYTRRSTHKRTLHIVRWTLVVTCMPSREGRGANLDVEGVRYIEMHRGPH